MNMLKSFGFTFIAFAALITTPVTFDSASTVSASEEIAATVEYSSLSFSSVGGASLK